MSGLAYIQATGGDLVSGSTRDAKRPPLVPGDYLSAHHGSRAPEVFGEKFDWRVISHQRTVMATLEP